MTLLLLCIVCVFLCYWPLANVGLLIEGWTLIFNVHNDLSACCTDKGETVSDRSTQVLTQKNWKIVLTQKSWKIVHYPAFSSSWALASVLANKLCVSSSKSVHACLTVSLSTLSASHLICPLTARVFEWGTWPYHCNLRLFTVVRRSLSGPIACWILARTSLLVTWSLYEMQSILR